MAKALRPGDPGQVGPYRLLARLGSGGMGQVYLGQSPGGRPVAVKVIRPELAAEADFRARFDREVAAARLVSGMFTALVVDADPQADLPWLATAYVAGPSLAEAVAARGPLPVTGVVALAAGLAEGLAAIHAAGLVHRDLKPTNVLLSRDGPRVIDFGISRAAEATALTGTGLVVGSPGFMSPEQADGRDVGAASDMFSLGAVITFAATGQGPFGTGSAPALLYRVVHSNADLSGVPGEIRGLAGRCLGKDPASRPTPAQVLDELGPLTVTSGWLPGLAVAPEPDGRDIGLLLWWAGDPGTEVADLPAPDQAAAPDGDPGPDDGQLTLTSAGARPPEPPGLAGAALVPGHGLASLPEPRSAELGSPGKGRPADRPDARPTVRRMSRRLVVGFAVAALVAASGVIAVLVMRGIGASGPAGAARQSSPPRRSPHGTVSPAASPGSGPLGASLGTNAPIPPALVTATAVNQYVVRVTWTPASPGATGYFVDNDCPTCVPGAYLSKSTGASTSTDFTVTPGSYTCFRVYAFNATGSSSWSTTMGCQGTPPLTLPATQRWTDTGVHVPDGIVVGISATGAYAAYPAGTEGPDGDPTCTPASSYPGATPAFSAPGLPCWSLVARIGSGAPFEIGVSRRFVTHGSGELSLGVNANDFSQNSGSLTVKIGKGGVP